MKRKKKDVDLHARHMDNTTPLVRSGYCKNRNPGPLVIVDGHKSEGLIIDLPQVPILSFVIDYLGAPFLITVHVQPKHFIRVQAHTKAKPSLPIMKTLCTRNATMFAICLRVK